MELCSTNGLTHAGHLARIYGALAAGGAPLLRGETLDEARRERVSGTDVVVGESVRRACGWMLATGAGRTAWGPAAQAFGHTGAGGALGFADPASQIGFAYTPSRIQPTSGADPRWQRLIAATYECLR
jgi:CubicO group peptidase (beta-lactamase class C family)